MSLCVLCLVMSDSLRFQGLYQAPQSVGDSPGKNTGVGCHALLQGIFWTQELNWDLLHCRLSRYQLKLQIYMHIFLREEYTGGKSKRSTDSMERPHFLKTDNLVDGLD